VKKKKGGKELARNIEAEKGKKNEKKMATPRPEGTVRWYQHIFKRQMEFWERSAEPNLGEEACDQGKRKERTRRKARVRKEKWGCWKGGGENFSRRVRKEKGTKIREGKLLGKNSAKGESGRGAQKKKKKEAALLNCDPRKKKGKQKDPSSSPKDTGKRPEEKKKERAHTGNRKKVDEGKSIFCGEKRTGRGKPAPVGPCGQGGRVEKNWTKTDRPRV